MLIFRCIRRRQQENDEDSLYQGLRLCTSTRVYCIETEILDNIVFGNRSFFNSYNLYFLDRDQTKNTQDPAYRKLLSDFFTMYIRSYPHMINVVTTPLT